MKKALIITTVGGFVPQFEMHDVKLLQEYGYCVHYASNFKHPVYYCDKAKLQAEKIILHQIDISKNPLKMIHNLKAFRQVKKLIDTEQINLVHCHNPVGAVIGRLAAAFSREKPYVIYTAHGFHFYKGAPKFNWIIYYTIERFLAKFTDLIITINKEDHFRAGRFHMKKNGCVKQIHGVGVDMGRFRPRPNLSVLKRKELGIPEDAFHVVTVAELNENKNQSIVIEAIAQLEDKNIYYTLCGKGTNEENLRKLIKKHHLQQQVRLLGYRTDVDEILQTADCFAFPSIREGLGMAAIEALATGVPLVAADNRGTREYVRSGKNGIKCGYDDVKDFMNAIEKLKADDEYRACLASNCRKMAECFSMEIVGKEMRHIYGIADEIIWVNYIRKTLKSRKNYAVSENLREAGAAKESEG